MILASKWHGSGQPAVILPWFGLDKSALAMAFEPAFTNTTGVSRLYIDLPGTGESRPVDPTSDAVLNTIVDTINASLSDRPFLLAGCSYGGYLAAALAARMPHSAQ